MTRCVLILGVITAVAVLVAGGRSEQPPSARMTLKSPAFENNRLIPIRHTGDGEDRSPPLEWSGLPDGTKELALICDDPDAPRREPWVHWVIYRIPADVAGLKAGIERSERLADPLGARQGRNSWNTIGYRGPAPPRHRGPHHYHFKLYALDAELALDPGLDKNKLLAAMKGHILAETKLVGIYER